MPVVGGFFMYGAEPPGFVVTGGVVGLGVEVGVAVGVPEGVPVGVAVGVPDGTGWTTGEEVMLGEGAGASVPLADGEGAGAGGRISQIGTDSGAGALTRALSSARSRAHSASEIVPLAAGAAGVAGGSRARAGDALRTVMMPVAHSAANWCFFMWRLPLWIIAGM
jgi:hypothetical protein